MEILGIEIKDGVYVSTGYEMFVNTGASELNKELTKTYYIKDKIERLKKVRHLLKGNNDNELGCYVTTPTSENWQEFDFNDIEDYVNQKKTSIFFNVWSEVSNKRFLEIEVYVENIFKESDNCKSEYEKISYLIEQQYSTHKKVFDHPKSDFIYWEQYNNIIYDILQIRINEISKTPINELRKPIKSTIKKPLIWNAQKNTIGTLFGVLYDKGFIKGNKSDVVRGINDMFDNLSKGSLTDNVNLKINTNEAKTNYDKKTKELLNDWICYLDK